MSGKFGMTTEWVCRSICGNKTSSHIRTDTELKNFSLYCPKCKQEIIINAKELQITVVKGIRVKFRQNNYC